LDEGAVFSCDQQTTDEPVKPTTLPKNGGNSQMPNKESEKTEKTEKLEKVEKPEKLEKTEKPEKAEKTERPERPKRDESVVYVGSKPLMSYITACVTQLNRNPEEVIIKARGRAISRAVDVAEVLRNRFMPDLKIRNIAISTEQVKTAEGNTANVSAIEVTLIRGAK
jgi:DNA-binding protein